MRHQGRGLSQGESVKEEEMLEVNNLYKYMDFNMCSKLKCSTQKPTFGRWEHAKCNFTARQNSPEKLKTFLSEKDGIFCRKNRTIMIGISHIFFFHQAKKLFSYISVQGTTHWEDIMKESSVEYCCNRKKKMRLHKVSGCHRDKQFIAIY